MQLSIIFCNLLSLHVTQKVIQLPFFFLYTLFPLLLFLGGLTKDYLAYISSFVRQGDMTSIGLPSVDTLANAFVKAIFIKKFCMCMEL